jgi:HAD superfamily hydrolase (TIGR01509 family)
LQEVEVLEAFKNFVGLSRREVAVGLLEHFHLQEKASEKAEDMQVKESWQALLQIRLKIYDKMLAEPKILQNHLCPYNVGLLKWAKQKNYPTGLATMSHRQQASKVLKLLDIDNYFNLIVTRDDVENGKPDPEIYLVVSEQLSIPPPECLVIEDSPSGIQAALNAGMHCIAVTNNFTRENVHQSNLLRKDFIVDELEELQRVVLHYISLKK